MKQINAVSYILLFIGLITISLNSCKNDKTESYYFEYLCTERNYPDGPYTHYIFIGGNYKRAYADCQEYACNYHGRTRNKIPIVSIVFVKSRNGSNKHNIDIDNAVLDENTIIGYTYIYRDTLINGASCPPISEIWVKEFQGIVKRTNK